MAPRICLRPLTPEPCSFERPISLSRLYVVAFSRIGREPPACSTRHRNPMNRKSSLSKGRSGSQSLPLLNRTQRRPNGFTLMELLIVIAIILILMLMAIPTIGSLKKQANETSALASIRAINQAQLQYQSSYPANGYACTLAALGGDPSAGAPSPT